MRFKQNWKNDDHLQAKITTKLHENCITRFVWVCSWGIVSLSGIQSSTLNVLHSMIPEELSLFLAFKTVFSTRKVLITSLVTQIARLNNVILSRILWLNCLLRLVIFKAVNRYCILYLYMTIVLLCLKNITDMFTYHFYSDARSCLKQCTERHLRSSSTSIAGTSPYDLCCVVVT
jgi:hypothetical protein